MSHTALFIGGPADGELREMECERGTSIAVAVSPSIRTLLQSMKDAVVPREPSFTTAWYHPQKLNFFGTILMVHVWENMPNELLEHRLLAHLLSDKAKAAIV